MNTQRRIKYIKKSVTQIRMKRTKTTDCHYNLSAACEYFRFYCHFLVHINPEWFWVLVLDFDIRSKSHKSNRCCCSFFLFCMRGSFRNTCTTVYYGLSYSACEIRRLVDVSSMHLRLVDFCFLSISHVKLVPSNLRFLAYFENINQEHKTRNNKKKQQWIKKFSSVKRNSIYIGRSEQSFDMLFEECHRMDHRDSIWFL